MAKQSCLVHPHVTAWVRASDTECFGLIHSFNAAVRALEDIDLSSADGIGQYGAMQIYPYQPSLQVPGAHRLFLLFEREGPYLNINGVGVPDLRKRFTASVVR